MRTRKLHGLAAATAVGTLALIATASAAGAQEPTGGPRIVGPTSQAGVTQGAAVVVEGDGCPPGSIVDIEFDAAPMASTQSDGAGAFSQAITIPVTPMDDSLEEAGEAAIAVACGDGRAVVVVGVNPAATDTSAGGEPTLPHTGAGSTAVLSGLGAGLVAIGAVLRRRSRTRVVPSSA